MTFKKGDLVMVVRPTPCCGAAANLGSVFSVEATKYTRGRCVYCKKCDDETVLGVKGLDDGFLTWASRLIKINPPADDTEEVADKELEGVV